MVSIGMSLVDPILTVMTVTVSVTQYYCFSFCFTYIYIYIVTINSNNPNIENEKQTYLSFFLFFVSSFVLFQFSKSNAMLDNKLII